VAELVKARAAHRRARFTADELHAAGLVADLVRRRFPIDSTGPATMARASIALADAVKAGQIIHRAQPVLDQAAAGAARRPLGEDWALSRARAGVDVCPLVAVALAAYAWRTLPTGGKPTVIGATRVA
jgi:hypothetical protein